MNYYLAQKLIISIEPDPSNPNLTPVVIEGPLQNINNAADIISKLLTFIFPFAGVLLFIYFVWGGFNLVTPQGDPEKVNQGKARLTHALIGFILLVFSYVFAGLVAKIFGLGLGIF